MKKYSNIYYFIIKEIDRIIFPMVFILLILVSCASVNQGSITEIKPGFNSKNLPQSTVASLTEKEFHKILEAEWEKGLLENPEWATRLGDNRYNDRLNDVSYDAIKKRQKDRRGLQTKLKEINRDELSLPDQLNFDLYLNKLEQSNFGYRFKTYFLPIDQMSGIQISFAGLQDYAPFNTAKDYQDYLARLKAFSKKVDQTIDLMKRGIEAGWVHPKIILRLVPDQIKAQYDRPVEESPLFIPFKKFPALAPNAKNIIKKSVYPAYITLYKFINETYLPACRDKIAAADLPGGKSYYAYRVKNYTTTDLTPQDIHQLGLNEVDRIRQEMLMIIKDVEFKGTFAGFLDSLRTDSNFYYLDENDLLDGYRVICKKADAQLPQLFGYLPRLPYGVKRMPDYQAPASPTAYYNSGSQEAGRPGFFMANTYLINTRPKYEMEALSLHEAVPGHHLQISLAQELDNLPKFRRYGGYTAFVEGWALYAEKLGEEMGFYQDPYSKFGQLTYEMWRACRLVVDTGIHALGWTRQRAIDFMLANTAKTENDVIVEIDRYIAWPGQALAYKIGELKILELRAKAEKQLGSSFDIRKFHDIVLRNGALPLDILEKQVLTYIAGVRQ